MLPHPLHKNKPRWHLPQDLGPLEAGGCQVLHTAEPSLAVLLLLGLCAETQGKICHFSDSHTHILANVTWDLVT